ncbi:MAG TPA: anthranilate synthase component I, partial [Dehalococcoidales bacterium]|nr:anthranilate synthase component I [Dehalococcoidales bacterium]
MYFPTIDEVITRQFEGNAIPIYREIVADLETPVSAFLKIKKDGQSFLLESVEGGQRLARYSFIGTDPYKVLTISKNDGIDPLVLVEREMNRFKVIPVPGLPRFFGGAVGFLGYECATRFENLPEPEEDTLNLPMAVFMFTDTLLVFDHVTHKIKIVSLVRLDKDIARSYAEACRR